MVLRIPKDFRSYEPKSFGNFTLRQAICLVVSFPIIAALFIPIFYLTNSIDLAGTVAVLVGIPIALCGFVKKDGVYLEKVIYALWISRFRYPRKRRYVMQNWYEDLELIAQSIGKEEDENEDANMEETTQLKNSTRRFLAHARKRTK